MVEIYFTERLLLVGNAIALCRKEKRQVDNLGCKIPRGLQASKVRKYFSIKGCTKEKRR